MIIYLGMPVYQGIHPETVRNIVAFDIDSQNQKNDLIIYFPQTSVISFSRNLIVKDALQKNADWIIMWDSDIQVKEKGFLDILIKDAFKFSAAMVGVPCRLRVGDEILLNCANKKDGKYVNLTKETCPLEAQPIEVIGTGFMLINCAWLKSNWPVGPWFSVIDTPTGMFPEDWHFCEQVREKGGIVIVEPRIKIVHWAMIGYAS